VPRTGNSSVFRHVVLRAGFSCVSAECGLELQEWIKRAEIGSRNPTYFDSSSIPVAPGYALRISIAAVRPAHWRASLSSSVSTLLALGLSSRSTELSSPAPSLTMSFL